MLLCSVACLRLPQKYSGTSTPVNPLLIVLNGRHLKINCASPHADYRKLPWQPGLFSCQGKPAESLSAMGGGWTNEGERKRWKEREIDKKGDARWIKPRWVQQKLTLAVHALLLSVINLESVSEHCSEGFIHDPIQPQSVWASHNIQELLAANT